MAIDDCYRADGLSARHNNKEILKLYEQYPFDKGRYKPNKWLEEVLKWFPPRSHRWFQATFPEPAQWFRSRLNYIRTAAVWSMVGHIMGLGDRHGENILLDTGTGDVVHVDFSCLFDKGLTLARPEMTPFRLTQNVIDAMGVTGFEGVFRSTCEATLRVLRRHRETYLSMAETFVHDPFVDWVKEGAFFTLIAASWSFLFFPLFADGSSTAGEAENPGAIDALNTLNGRLIGTLIGINSAPSLPLSVEGQVQRLLDEASTLENLGQMYIWWMPWY